VPLHEYCDLVIVRHRGRMIRSIGDARPSSIVLPLQRTVELLPLAAPARARRRIRNKNHRQGTGSLRQGHPTTWPLAA
jgi:hypothetical protein